MKKVAINFSWSFILIFVYSCIYTDFVSSQCLDDQKTLLLELKNNLTFEPKSDLDNLVGWNETTDCCLWSGVECDLPSGRVTGLDLSRKGIIGGINSSSSLFNLKFLQQLNLAGNNIRSEIPSSIGKLSSLRYLNLSGTGFRGQVPIEISQLVELSVLDLSYYLGPFPSFNDNPKLHMEKPNLATIIQNLNDIRELHLDGVNNSAMGDKWCEALSSSLPLLEVLSMSHCDLRGEIHESFSKLHHLSVIQLCSNPRLTGPVPEFLALFTNLTRLEICVCDLTGTVPKKIFQVSTLRYIALSANNKLEGTLPEFYKNGSLEEIELSETNFSGHLPNSISNLKRLRNIDLSDCRFHGSIPSSMEMLDHLEDVDLSVNHFFGPIPSFSSAKKLISLDLSDNSLNGTITGTDWGKLLNLELLYLGTNALDGIIPRSIFSLPSVSDIGLERNKFSGKLNEFANATSSMLESLNMNRNNLEGTKILSEILHKFKNLKYLDLSYNQFSINTDGCDVNSTFPQLNSLILASCNLRFIPDFLKNQTSLDNLDLSMNHISGKIPKWIWRNTVFFPDYSSLNLSFNHLVHFEPPQSPLNVSTLSWNNIDLQSNNLQGKFPKALCNATQLQLLNLQDNLLDGTLPDCLIAMTTLPVLDLRNNKIGGMISDNFRKNCSLQTLNLNGNILQGQIPQSLSNCEGLRVLDLGNNLLNDTFPCFLRSLSNLQVLVLRSNMFHGTVVCSDSPSIWPMLQILDLASNHFSGELRAQFLFKWTAMMAGTNNGLPKTGYLQSNINGGYYQNQVSVTFKNNEYDMQYILNIFTSIDFSNNAFNGELPLELGDLNALIVLNLSRNSFWGNIPSSIGNLSQIESLDLSCNNLHGNIPPQLANLNFLGYLNLSFNKLSGNIPTSTQLQLFDPSSYEGNQGLYGPPLTPLSVSVPHPGMDPSISSQESNWSSNSEIKWMIMGAEVGFPVGITIFLGPLLYIKRYREWYCKQLHRLVLKITQKDDGANGGRRKGRQQSQ